MYFSTDFEYSFISSPYTFLYFFRPIWATHTKLRRRVDDEVNIYLRDNDNTAELLGKLRKRNISSTPSWKKTTTTTSSRTEAIHTFFCCVFSSFPSNPMMMQAEKWLQNSMPAIHSELSLEKKYKLRACSWQWNAHAKKEEETPSMYVIHNFLDEIQLDFDVRHLREIDKCSRIWCSSAGRNRTIAYMWKFHPETAVCTVCNVHFKGVKNARIQPKMNRICVFMENLLHFLVTHRQRIYGAVEKRKILACT